LINENKEVRRKPYCSGIDDGAKATTITFWTEHLVLATREVAAKANRKHFHPLFTQCICFVIAMRAENVKRQSERLAPFSSLLNALDFH
jgi:hypothetical protein